MLIRAISREEDHLSKQAGVSKIMVEGVVHPAQQQLLCGVQNQILKKPKKLEK